MHNIVSDILAISTDGLASPSIKLKLETQARGTHPYGWGFGWYPNDGQAAIVTKDPVARDTQVLVDAITDWANFRSTCFLAKVRGAAKGYTHHETQPFSRAFAGRDWLFVHNGDLDKERLRALHATENHFLEPLGKTDSELAFVYLLSNVVEVEARKLSEVSPDRLRAWFAALDALGSADMILTDGQTVVAYHGTASQRELYHARVQPPAGELALEAESLRLGMNDPRDTYRTKLIITSAAFGSGQWVRMQPGQMLIARRGNIVFDSHPENMAVETPGLHTSQHPQAQQLQAQQLQGVPGHAAPQPAAAPESPSPGSAGQPQTQMQEQRQEQTPSPDAGAPLRDGHSVIILRSTERRALGDTLAYRLYELVHRTEYRYSHPVEHSTHIFRLHPEENHQQEILQASVAINQPGEAIQFEDVFGNHAIHYTIEKPYDHLVVEARSRLKVFLFPPDDHSLTRRQASIPVVWMPWQQQMMMPYLLPAELPESQLDELNAYAMSFVERNDHNLLETLKDINATIYRDYEYLPGSTSLNTTPFEVFATRRGVCQDFANLFICLARLLNVPARYRMGYIYTGADYENTIQSEASHAWVELYLPFVGWRGFDPTNGILVGQDHICVARGRNYRDATPTSGTIFRGGGEETLTVEVKIDEVMS